MMAHELLNRRALESEGEAHPEGDSSLAGGLGDFGSLLLLQPLAAGTYGFHTIPNEDEWTLIFSRDTTAWGSYSYDESRDALRVQVTPESAPFREKMVFTFDDMADGAATVRLR